MSMHQENFLKDFLVECEEYLDSLDRELVAIEENPEKSDILESIFRDFHTVKGNAGILGLTKMEKVAHLGESLLHLLREGALPVNQDSIGGMLLTVDAVREIAWLLQNENHEGQESYEGLAVHIQSLIAAAEPSKIKKSRQKNGAPTNGSAKKAALVPQTSLSPPADGIEQESSASELGDKEAGKQGGSAVDQSVRVSVHQLDHLMALMGELVLARNQILSFAASQVDTSFLSATGHLNRLTTELQERVNKTRMQPIERLWGRFPRLVRDLATGLGKEVDLILEGGDTEMDRTLLEAVRDPFLHLLRNAVDHGIESPVERESAGKPRHGQIIIRAWHQGGQVLVEMQDDGKGIDHEAIRVRLVERGLVAASMAQQMSPEELRQMIFLPGFSTAQTVSNVSGRGVGMDVVRTNIERLGGAIQLESKPGEGTRIQVRLPLTLAIIPTLIVESAGQRYAIPQSSLLEVVRLKGAQARQALEKVQNAWVYRLRGKLLPLVDLSRELKLSLDDPGQPPLRIEPGTGRDLLNIVVLQVGRHRFGLLVDNIKDTQEAVVKPMGKQVKDLKVFSGATILHDGKVSLILDVAGFAEKSHVLKEAAEESAARHVQNEDGTLRDTQLVLVAEGFSGSPLALPLDRVTRLEVFPSTLIETVDGRPMVQYRGAILPLVPLNHLWDEKGALQKKFTCEQWPAKLSVIVHQHGEKYAGLIVAKIHDILEDVLEIQTTHTREGILGTTVVGGRIAEVLDIEKVISIIEPAFFESAAVLT